MQAEFHLHNGAITLFINGKPYLCVTYKSTESVNDAYFAETVSRSVADLAARGIHVHFVPIFFDWPAPGQYDFSRMDWRVQQVLAADSQAWVVIRVQAISMAPRWWMEAHPDGVVQFGYGRGVETPRPANQTLPAPSLGSDFWDEHGIPALTALAQHVKAQPYASRVIGYLPTAYNTNEWFFRSYDAQQVNDLCPAMQRRFATHLKETYGSEDGHVPDRLERHLADECYLFDPDPRRSKSPVTAFYQFYSNLCAETILKAAQALRQVHQLDRIIVGTFYGYLLELAQFYWLADSGHLALRRLLEPDGLDFTCNPLAYFTRNIHELPGGGFVWSLSTGCDSSRLHGKAYFGEDDFPPPDGIGLATWAGGQTAGEDIETLRRNFSFTLCKGQNQWWYDLGGHYFDGQDRLDMVQQCAQIAGDALNRNRSSVSEVAVILDELAPTYLQLDYDFQRAVFWENFFHSFARIGAPVDLLMLSDLEKADLSRYKAVFFPTCFALTTADRARIENLKSGGRTLVFYQADGYIDPASKTPFDLQRICDLTGMSLLKAENHWHSFPRLTTLSGHPLLVGFEDQPFGVRGEKLLYFYINDPTVEPLARFNGLGALGMARKVFPEWTSIYCAVPVIDPALVHNIIKSAGVHCFTSDRLDITYACQDYVALFTRRGGARTLDLPQVRRVRELFHAAVQTTSLVTQVTWQAEPYTTYLFLLE